MSRNGKAKPQGDAVRGEQILVTFDRQMAREIHAVMLDTNYADVFFVISDKQDHIATTRC